MIRIDLGRGGHGSLRDVCSGFMMMFMIGQVSQALLIFLHSSVISVPGPLFFLKMGKGIRGIQTKCCGVFN